MWYLVGLIWLALVAGIFWVYGNKRRRAEAEREKQLSALIYEAKISARGATDAPAAVALPVELVPTFAPAVAPVKAVVRKPRLLGQPDALLYLLFRTGLPDHEVFANLTLADVVEPAPELNGFERDQSLRKFSQQRLHIVVCSKQLEVVAVALLRANAATDTLIETSLQTAGIKLLRIDPAALPRHQQLRAMIYGEAAPGAV